VRIVFDLDNTLVDAFGSEVRPGMVALLARLRAEGHTLVLWTSSPRQRAREILRLHDLERFFSRCIFREDYDPRDEDLPKDIRRVGGDFLVEDDPAAVAFARSKGRRAFLVTPYRRGMPADRAQVADLHAAIARPRRFLGRLFG
jgi:phosphoglycolate phosphatase-like HAD superfamily hydrolase